MRNILNNKFANTRRDSDQSSVCSTQSGWSQTSNATPNRDA